MRLDDAGEEKKAAVEEAPKPKEEAKPLAKPAEPTPAPPSSTAEEVPQTVVGQVIGLDSNQIALWSEIQRIMSQTSPKNTPSVTGECCLILVVSHQ